MQRRWSWRSRTLRALAYQVFALALIAAGAGFLMHNTLVNMRVRGIQSGFDFLTSTAGFDIGESPIAYESTDPYWKAFAVGVLNTLRVAAIGIVATTLLGTLAGVGRFSRNAIVRGLSYGYVELFRNVPVLLQLLTWYILFTQVLPPINEAIRLAPGIYIIDDPHRVRGLRSKPFDGEGVANTRRALIENGRLTSWLLDCASARQLGLETTGHAARGTGGPPSPSSTNLYLEAGKLPVKDLIADIKQGFYVTELMGMGVNGVTGDYSRGAAGFWIENGEIAFPVSEVTIAGNLKAMFAHLTPANDLEFRHGVNAPTVRIEGMTLAGA